MDYTEFTNADYRNDLIMRYCRKSRKTLAQVAEKLGLKPNYTKKLLKELTDSDRLYLYTTASGEFYRTSSWIRLHYDESDLLSYK